MGLALPKVARYRNIEWVQPPREELDESLSRSGIGQVWPVADSYYIDGDYVRVSQRDPDRMRLYYPMAHPELPFELADLANQADLAAIEDDGEYGREMDNRILVFVSKWGLLSTRIDPSFGPIPEEVDRDLIYHIGLHASDVAGMLWMLVHKDLDGARLQLNKRLRVFNPVVVPVYDSPRSDPVALKLGWGFRTLADAIYWHVASYATGERQLGRCLECGRFFHKTDGRQRFCPHDGFDGIGRRQSRCGLRYRAKKARERAQKKEG